MYCPVFMEPPELGRFFPGFDENWAPQIPRDDEIHPFGDILQHPLEPHWEKQAASKDRSWPGHGRHLLFDMLDNTPPQSDGECHLELPSGYVKIAIENGH